MIGLVDRVLGLLEEGLRIFEVRDARGLVLHEAVGEEFGTGAAVLAFVSRWNMSNLRPVAFSIAGTIFGSRPRRT